MTAAFGNLTAGETALVASPARVYAAAAVVCLLRHGGRATVKTVSRELGNLGTRRTLAALDAAKRERLVWTRDRNVWQATTAARAKYLEGAAQAAA